MADQKTRGSAGTVPKQNARTYSDEVSITDEPIHPGEPINDPKIRNAVCDSWNRANPGTLQAREQGFDTVGKWVGNERVFIDPQLAEPSITLAEARKNNEIPHVTQVELPDGGDQYVDVHVHPYRRGTYVATIDGKQMLAEYGPSSGDVMSNVYARGWQGRNQTSYVLDYSGLYRITGHYSEVTHIATLKQICPVAK